MQGLLSDLVAYFELLKKDCRSLMPCPQWHGIVQEFQIISSGYICISKLWWQQRVAE